MGYFSIVTDALTSMFSSGWFFLSHGGWILFLFLAILIAQKIYMNTIQGRFAASNVKVFLHIKVQRENLQSTLAVEQIFSHLHALQSNLTWANKFLEGQFQLGMSCEMVSIGGKINYIIQTYDKYINLVEAAFYSQYPNAEITIVEDYMKNLSHWDPLHSTWDLWGTEFTFTKDWAYPLKTYRQFEHMAAEEKIIDPLAGILEALGKAEPHELMSLQYCIRPISDSTWQPHVQEIAKELKGEKKPESKGIFGSIIHAVDEVAVKGIFGLFSGGGGHGAEEKKSDFPVVQRMSEGEKRVLTAVEEKLAKPGWETKIRMLYIAPKDRFDNTKRTALIGGLRPLSSMNANNLKPNMKTWTNTNYKLSKTLEKPYLEYMNQHKKHHFLGGYLARSMWIGAPAMIMNTEELATLFHFPLSTVTVPPVESIEVKKGQPPANLPILG